MPTILIIGPYAFIFFSSDEHEPPHIHVKRDKMLAKFWLKPVSLAKNAGFKRYELNRIKKHVVKNQQTFLEAWDEHFGA